MFRLQTPAIVALALLVVVVVYSISQEEGDGPVATVLWATEEFLEGDWNQSNVPPDRWIGIITTEEGWHRFPGESGHSVDRMGEQPDFDTSVAFIAYMGMMPSGGYSVTLERIEYMSGGPGGASRLVVQIHVSRPGADEVVTQVLTHPVDVITIAKDEWPDGALKALVDGSVIIDVVDQNGRTWGPGHIL